MGRGVPAGLAQMGIERGDLVTLGGGAFKVTIVLSLLPLEEKKSRRRPGSVDGRGCQHVTHIAHIA